MSEEQRLDRFFSFFSRALDRPFRRIFRYEYDDLSGIPGPYLLLANHNMDIDPILVGLAVRHRITFVATENVLRKPLAAWFLMRYLRPILHTKGKKGTATVMTLLRLLRSGGSAALFAEGNRSFDGVTGEIPPATTKLARRSGASLVTFRLEGGYLSQPRWGVSLRKGKIRGRLVHVYTPEEMKGMTEEALYAAVSADLHEDAFARQREERVEYVGKKPAFGMESMLFACPKCGKFGTLTTTDISLKCSCGFSAVYDLTGTLTAPDGTVSTPRELNLMQQELLKERAENSPAGTLLFEDPVRISLVNEKHRTEPPRDAKLAAFPEGFSVNGKLFTPQELEGAAVFSRNVLSVHLESGEQYEIRGEGNFNAYKYLCLLRLLKPGTVQL